ncbi:MAG: glycosyl hydrolase family 8 [Actinomycetota bacterium]
MASHRATLEPPAQLEPGAEAPELTRRRRGVLAASVGADVPHMVVLALFALVVHAVNMFNAPATLEDEGTYASQAWAVLRLHRLTPYTFTYDHAPGGWILGALWMLVTGGPKTFGGTIPSERVLMLILFVGSVPLLYRLCRKLGCSRATASLAAVLFTVSPLSLAYGRAFLLDNVMVFWLLVSLNLLLDGWGRLSRLVLSGIAFGIAVLSKETALFLLPALAYVAYRQRWKHQGRFAVGAWLVPAAIVMSWYPLYAALKGELLPAGSAFGFAIFSHTSGHASLVDEVRWQLSRQGGNPFSLHNAFWQLVHHTWLPLDPILFIGGTVAIAVNLLRGVRNRRALAAGLLGFFPLIYLARGGIVFDYYVLFALPFLALNIGVAAGGLLDRPSPVLAWSAALVAVAVAGGFFLANGRLQPFFTSQPAKPDREAVAWVKKNIPPASRMVVADNFWSDLHEKGFDGPAFPYAESHWKVAEDPSVKNGVFHDDWRTVDYLLTNDLTQGDFHSTGDTVALAAMQHASLVKSWTAGGYTARLWRVNGASGQTGAGAPGSAGPPQLNPMTAATGYLDATFDQQGAFTAADGSVTSEAESYALLRAVWSNDPATFAQVWGWTQTHLQRPDGLMSWLYQGGKVADPSTATDADTDIAYALAVAGRQWNQPAYLAEARRMVAAIWSVEVVEVKGAPYAVAGDWAASGPVLAIDPSYFAPYAYRVFAQLDPGEDWYGLLNAGYSLMNNAAQAPLGAAVSSGLPPDWIGMDRATGALQPLALSGKGTTTSYGYDADRVFWRIALDYRWTGDTRDAAFLRRASFLDQEVARKGTVSAVYAHSGQVVSDAYSPVAIAGALAALSVLDTPKADGLYWQGIVGAAAQGTKGTYWGDPSDLYGQEWVWFATAFYTNRLPNLWPT